MQCPTAPCFSAPLFAKKSFKKGAFTVTLFALLAGMGALSAAHASGTLGGIDTVPGVATLPIAVGGNPGITLMPNLSNPAEPYVIFSGPVNEGVIKAAVTPSANNPNGTPGTYATTISTDGSMVIGSSLGTPPSKVLTVTGPAQFLGNSATTSVVIDGSGTISIGNDSTGGIYLNKMPPATTGIQYYNAITLGNTTQGVYLSSNGGVGVVDSTYQTYVNASGISLGARPVGNAAPNTTIFLDAANGSASFTNPSQTATISLNGTTIKRLVPKFTEQIVAIALGNAGDNWVGTTTVYTTAVHDICMLQANQTDGMDNNCTVGGDPGGQWSIRADAGIAGTGQSAETNCSIKCYDWTQ